MRVVLDTNVLVSALGRQGLPAEVLTLCLDVDRFTILTTEPLLRELDRVLDYPKLRRHVSDQNKYAFVVGLARVAELVEPGAEVTVINADPDDNRLLECAVAGRADYIVTGDEHLLTLGSLGETRIVPPGDFLSLAGH